MASELSYPSGIRHRTVGVLVSFVALATRSAGAAPEETEPIRIDYTAPANCPDASEFSDRVFERTSKARSASEAEAARTFVVVIEASSEGTHGSLVVRQEGISTVARRVSGKNCDEVARALSFATALAIDPEAALGPEPAMAGSGEDSKNQNGSAKAPEPRRDDATTRTDATTPGTPDPSPTSDRRTALLVGASAAFGPAPTPGFGASAAFEWSSPRPVVLPSAVGLELVYLTSAAYGVAGAKSSFDFFYARPYVCTLGLALGAGLGLSPCVGGALGAVVASGSEIATPATETRFWATGEFALRFDVALSADWFVDGTASLVVPFTRYHFLFRTPDTRIHYVPAVTAAVGLRLGRRL